MKRFMLHYFGDAAPVVRTGEQQREFGDVEGMDELRVGEFAELDRVTIVRLTDTVDPDTLLYTLGLQVRASKAMLKLGARTIGEASKVSASELMAVRGFGPSALCALRDALASHGYRLRGER